MFYPGDDVKSKYDGAIEVRLNRRGKLRVKNRRYKKHTQDDLVYIRRSPDYCKKNPKIGSHGNYARQL